MNKIKKLMPYIFILGIYGIFGILLILTEKSLTFILLFFHWIFGMNATIAAFLFLILYIILIGWIYFYLVIVMFYKVKMNSETKVLYSLFEIVFGLTVLFIFGLSGLTGYEFTNIKSSFGITIATSLGYYGGIYVIVRGLESFSDDGKRKRILIFDLKSESWFVKFLKYLLKISRQ